VEIIENLDSLSIPDLMERFEKDIRSGCHPTRAEASRSLAGKELEKRADRNSREIVPALALRLSDMRRQSLDGVEKSVYDGLDMLLTWIQCEKG
jgi:hypothetical protein